MEAPSARARTLTSAALARPEARYAIAGAFVGLFYMGFTVLLSSAAGLALPLAIAIAYFFTVLLHFTLQRLFVFRHVESFALQVRHQIGRYVVLGSIQYAINTTATQLLPGPLGVSPEVVFVLTTGTLSVLSFLLLRLAVFHSD